MELRVGVWGRHGDGQGLAMRGQHRTANVMVRAVHEASPRLYYSIQEGAVPHEILSRSITPDRVASILRYYNRHIQFMPKAGLDQLAPAVKVAGKRQPSCTSTVLQHAQTDVSLLVKQVNRLPEKQ